MRYFKMSDESIGRFVRSACKHIVDMSMTVVSAVVIYYMITEVDWNFIASLFRLGGY